MTCDILDLKDRKYISSPYYNLFFDKKTGFTARWGKTVDDDPQCCPYGPEILDLEISSAAEDDVNSDDQFVIHTGHGCRGCGCRQFCYKQNRSGGSVHMSFTTFCDIMDRMPKTLCSIAFGVLSPIEQHPHVWRIFYECRQRGVVPNVTINQELSDETASNLAKYCGAVAVSVNPYNKEIAYDAIKKLSQDHNMDQINIHIVLSKDSVGFIKEVVDDIKTDVKLFRMNALVMLSFKDKANTHAMQPITTDYYKAVIDYCTIAGINFGFDSCSAKCYLEAIKDDPNKDKLEQFVEPCESLMFSSYIDVHGTLYACSFLEKTGMWKEGINVLDYDNFMDIWNHPQVQKWRRLLLKYGRGCPEYQIGG